MYIKLALVFLLPALSVAADVHRCGDTWTNKSCDATSEATPEVAAPDTQAATRKAKAERNSWLHELEMRRFRAKREHKLDVDVGDVRQICEDLNTPATECRKAIAERSSKIEEQILHARELDLKKAELEQKAKSTPQEPPTRIIVQNNDWDYRLPRPTPYLPPVLPPTPQYRDPMKWPDDTESKPHHRH